MMSAQEKRQAKGGETKVGLEGLTEDYVADLITKIQGVIPLLAQLNGISDTAKKEIERQITEYALSIKTSKLDPTQLEEFFKRPYHLIPVPRRPDSWNLIIPKFIDLQVGWLESSTPSYNIFLINRYMDWLGEIPDAIKRQLNWKTPPELILEGEELRGSSEALDYAEGKYKGLIGARDEKGIKVNPKRTFDLLAALIKDGVLPFGIKPVKSEDIVNRPLDFKLRPYQEQAWDQFLKYSNVGVYWPPGMGKTLYGLKAVTSIKGPSIIAAPTRLLVEQWEDRIETHTDLKLGEEVYVTTYQGAVKLAAQLKAKGVSLKLKVIDEVHHLPANFFVKLAMIQTDYSIGLSATPFREDGREEFIFALTGKPVGLSWEFFKKAGLIKAPVAHVWIVKNFEAKVKKVEDLLKDDMRTVIFSDSIDAGKILAARFKLPFAYGETKENMATILANRTVVVSRIGDEGMSLPDLERIIEVSFLGGSRRQELQRFLRGAHSQVAEPSDHILMTLEEYVSFRKRFYSIMDKGFKIVLHREGVSEKVIEASEQRAASPRATRPTFTVRRSDPRDAPSSMPSPAFAPGTPEIVKTMPGVQTIMGKLNKSDRTFFTLLLGRDGEWFARKSIPMALGIANLNHIDISGMVDRKWVEKRTVGGEAQYRTNSRGTA